MLKYSIWAYLVLNTILCAKLAEAEMYGAIVLSITTQILLLLDGYHTRVKLIDKIYSDIEAN